MKALEEIMAELPAARRKKIAKRTAALVAREMTLREITLTAAEVAAR